MRLLIALVVWCLVAIVVGIALGRIMHVEGERA
jgi:hypothetical protein